MGRFQGGHGSHLPPAVAERGLHQDKGPQGHAHIAGTESARQRERRRKQEDVSQEPETGLLPGKDDILAQANPQAPGSCYHPSAVADPLYCLWGNRHIATVGQHRGQIAQEPHPDQGHPGQPAIGPHEDEKDQVREDQQAGIKPPESRGLRHGEVDGRRLQGKGQHGPARPAQRQILQPGQTASPEERDPETEQQSQ